MEKASGKKLELDDNDDGRLAKLAARKARKYNASIYKWNAALIGLQEELMEDVLKRGMPHVRNRRRLTEPNTWHTTMLGEVGINDEGPLPWIERDYTPISSAKEWERGRCDILIKIYNDGKLTSWLHTLQPQAQVLMSFPVRTLRVPSLVQEDDSDGGGFQPASGLMLLAGTGIVALPQLLAHRDPINMLGISTPKRSQLRVNIDAVVSYREDDILMLVQLSEWCREGAIEGEGHKGVRNLTLTITEKREDGGDAQPPPYEYAADQESPEDAFKGLPNATVLRSQRVTQIIVTDAVSRMEQPCRVIVSGPNTFNDAVKLLLLNVIDSDHVTILSA